MEIEFSLVSPSGQSLRLETRNGKYATYTLLTGVDGFGIVPVEARFTESIQDGGRELGTRAKHRDILLPIDIAGVDRESTLAAARVLRNTLRSVKGLPSPKIVAEFSTGEKWQLPIVLTTGGTETYTRYGENIISWLLTVRAAQPYWESVSTLAWSLTADEQVDGLLPDLAELKVSSSSTIGEFTVDNPGDVPVPVQTILRGPFTSVSMSVNGEGWEYEQPILSGSRVVVNSETNRVYDFTTGENLYSNLAPAPRFLTVPPGESVISLTAPGVSPSSRIDFYFKPRYELIH